VECLLVSAPQLPDKAKPMLTYLS